MVFEGRGCTVYERKAEYMYKYMFISLVKTTTIAALTA